MELLNDLDFVWEVERGSSIAQLQRVAVVGLPDRIGGKSKKAASKVAKTEATATAKSPAPEGDLLDRDTKRPTAATGHDSSWWVASHGSRIVRPPFECISQHVAVPKPWRGALSTTSMEIPASGSQSQAAGTLRGRTAPTDDREAEDSESKDRAEASASRHNRIAQPINPLGNSAIAHSQFQQFLDSEYVGALSSLHNVHPAIPNVTTANPSRLVAALRQQHYQPAALPIHALMPPAHHLGLLGLQSTLPLATLQALHGQRPSNHALAALLSGSGASRALPPSDVSSARAGTSSNLHSAQIRALVNASLVSPTSSAAANAVSAALGGPEQTQTATLFLPSAAPWLPSSLEFTTTRARQHISDDSILHLASLMTGTSRRSVGANAAAELLWNLPPRSSDPFAAAFPEWRVNNSTSAGARMNESAAPLRLDPLGHMRSPLGATAGTTFVAGQTTTLVVSILCENSTNSTAVIPQLLPASATSNRALRNERSDAPGFVAGLLQSPTQQAASARHLTTSAPGVFQQQLSTQASPSEDTSDAEDTE